MDWQNVVAVVGAIAGLAGLASSWRTSRASARKDDVAALSGIIDALQDEIARLQKRITCLENENESLRKDNQMLVAHIAKQAGGNSAR